MPELPEVETVRRGLAPVLVGRKIAAVTARRADLRTPLPKDLAARLTGRRVRALERRAKYLLAHLDDGTVLIAHLGMSGRFRVIPGPPPPPGPHDHLDLVTDAGVTVRFSDPRRFGLIALVAEAGLSGHPLLSGLGPEPLDRAFTARVLEARLKGRRGPVKNALMDQRVVAGLGNIYVSEALFYAGLSPLRSTATVTGARAAELVAAVKKVLRAAIAAGGSTLRDYRRAAGELGEFQHRFAVYDRAGLPCPGCDCDVERTGGIRRIVQGGRATFYCKKRQR
jgi:formamidopyrimidine-DNA glycosylase